MATAPGCFQRKGAQSSIPLCSVPTSHLWDWEGGLMPPCTHQACLDSAMQTAPRETGKGTTIPPLTHPAAEQLPQSPAKGPAMLWVQGSNTSSVGVRIPRIWPCPEHPVTIESPMLWAGRDLKGNLRQRSCTIQNSLISLLPYDCPCRRMPGH